MKNKYKVIPSTSRISLNEATIFNDLISLPPELKYKHVWQSARLKLKFRFCINKVLKAAVQGKEEEAYLLKFNDHKYTWLDHQTLTFSKYIILPKSRKLGYWNTLIGISFIYTAIFMPYLLSFPPTNYQFLDIFDQCFSVIYFVDFLINCNLAFLSKLGNLVLDRKKILWRYFKGWMIIDIIAFIPFEIFINNGDHSSKFSKLARVPRLYKILKISKVFKWIKFTKNQDTIMKIQDIISVRHSVIQMAFRFLTIILFIHISACIWCFIGKVQPDSPDTWIAQKSLTDSYDSTVYLTAAYWSFTTFSTVGYGDITAGTDAERIYTVIWMLCSLQFLGISIATLTSFLGKIDTHDKILINKLAIIDEFAMEVGIEKSLRLEMRKALRKTSTITSFSFLEKLSLFNELPKSLRFDLALAMHRGAARVITFFRNKDDSVFSAIVPLLSPMFCKDSDMVYQAGNIPEEFYFIVKGRVVYMNPLDKTGLYLVKKNDYFGDIELLLKETRKFSAACRENCEFLVFSAMLLKRIKKTHPAVWVELKCVAKERKYILERSQMRVVWLREVRRTLCKSEADIIQFKTFQKIKREMRNSLRSSLRLGSQEIDEIDIIRKIEEMEYRIDRLKNDFIKVKARPFKQ